MRVQMLLSSMYAIMCCRVATAGDHDYVVPNTGTRAWVYGMNLQEAKPWHSWSLPGDDLVGFSKQCLGTNKLFRQSIILHQLYASAQVPFIATTIS